MNGVVDLDSDDSEFVEVDPTGRYGRYNEILGKGASKTVYRGFDEYEGIEVAWNQVKLYDFLQSPEDLERLYCEIHLLKTLKHNNIMKFCTSWVDTANRNINFVTEMFTSGTLRQYRLKHKRVNIRAIKHWCRQILQGLLYLHSHDPPVIHRDLKCDNIFINGNQGEVKIGDLGLAAILRKSHAARCVVVKVLSVNIYQQNLKTFGTPEFMAPEVYEEEYNELVDIYSFGMCILEMVTFEYPYSECTHPAQIYKKVISGKKPSALYKVKDAEVRQFVDKCLATVSHRMSAWELLNDPFLQIEDYIHDLRPVINYQRDFEEFGPILTQRLLSAQHSTNSSVVNGYTSYHGYEPEIDLDCRSVEYEGNEIDLFTGHEDQHWDNVDITIRGRRGEDGNIFLRLRIADKEGPARNIYFPFDIETDTALSVATEMVAELDITDQDVTKIAEMIDGEIASLVPDWNSGPRIEESPSPNCCHNCDSDGSVKGYLTSQCLKQGCGAIHGRFEEITYDIENEGLEVNSQNDPDDETPNFGQSTNVNGAATPVLLKNYENEIKKELEWLKSKYQMQLRGLRNRQTKSSNSDSDHKECDLSVLEHDDDDYDPKSFVSAHNSWGPMHMDINNDFCSGNLNPNSLHRTSSLPVDATGL
ncbi:hypothetical protein CASFOL_021601 [Castilleja foliolosa]|uniref:non-specific serine/threonine protein kinase n=1 Tax=Castilleja foliolosa TaxID=1961234 RepID=A0ABD3D163_9LAMI